MSSRNYVWLVFANGYQTPSANNRFMPASGGFSRRVAAMARYPAPPNSVNHCSLGPGDLFAFSTAWTRK